MAATESEIQRAREENIPVNLPVPDDDKHDDLTKEVPGAQKESENTTNEPPYTILEEWRKISIIMTASFLGLVSPISSSTYFPSVNQISSDLHKSISLINLTVTMYMVSHHDNT